MQCMWTQWLWPRSWLLYLAILILASLFPCLWVITVDATARCFTRDPAVYYNAFKDRSGIDFLSGTLSLSVRGAATTRGIVTLAGRLVMVRHSWIDRNPSHSKVDLAVQVMLLAPRKLWRQEIINNFASLPYFQLRDNLWPGFCLCLHPLSWWR